MEPHTKEVWRLSYLLNYGLYIIVGETDMRDKYAICFRALGRAGSRIGAR